jgi:hypothetical protein|tara:strand:- start:14 stop:517 length:504 start_codon:yes stop_codon:yes gene_type:complete
MAVSRGISNISGVPIASVSTRNGIAKANIWDVSGEQRQQSLFKTLSEDGAATFGQGRNSASFRVAGANARVFFTYALNAANTNYQFVFNISGLTQNGWICAISRSADFANDIIGGESIGSSDGNKSIVVNSSSLRIRDVYIGIWNDPNFAGGSRDRIDVSNLLVNIV